MYNWLFNVDFVILGVFKGKYIYFFFPLCFVQVDQASGFVTKTILCMPIKNGSDEIIGKTDYSICI